MTAENNKKSSNEHWDRIFSTTEETKLGWYEEDFSRLFKLLKKIRGWQKATIFLAGAGTSHLIEYFVARGIRLVINDISQEALNIVQQRLKDKAPDAIWLCQDIAREVRDPLPAIDIWIDRAVLHFLTDRTDIEGYFENLRSLLKSSGHVIFAEYSKNSADKCAGLKIQRYSKNELQTKLGSSYKLVSHFNYTYINPIGKPRPYIYTLFKREA